MVLPAVNSGPPRFLVVEELVGRMFRPVPAEVVESSKDSAGLVLLRNGNAGLPSPFRAIERLEYQRVGAFDLDVLRSGTKSCHVALRLRINSIRALLSNPPTNYDTYRRINDTYRLQNDTYRLNRRQ